jgi:hypothetical protein
MQVKYSDGSLIRARLGPFIGNAFIVLLFSRAPSILVFLSVGHGSEIAGAAAAPRSTSAAPVPAAVTFSPESAAVFAGRGAAVLESLQLLAL